MLGPAGLFLKVTRQPIVSYAVSAR
jgi:hypothetical protein